jgi:hypothetical protein
VAIAPRNLQRIGSAINAAVFGFFADRVKLFAGSARVFS